MSSNFHGSQSLPTVDQLENVPYMYFLKRGSIINQRSQNCYKMTVFLTTNDKNS